MKRKLTVFMGLFLLIACVASVNKAAVIKAAGDYTKTELKVKAVKDITVFNDYTDYINNININTNLTGYEDGINIFKFNLEDDGYISLLVTCRKVDKIIEKYGSSTSYDVSDATVTATVYRDAGLLYPVTPAISAKGKTKGELAPKIALDKGTYYIAVTVDKYSNTKSGSTTMVVSCLGTAELIVYYQPLECDEKYRPSMVGSENLLEMETTFQGVLTATNPKDYYMFVLEDKAMVKINCMYSSVNSAKFTLYSPEREELLTKTITGNNIWYNVEKYLEPGIYFCSLETLKQYDSGTTSILINQTIYPLTLEQVNHTVNSYVQVTTIDDPLEIRYVLGKLTNSELTSPKWNKGKIITDTRQFGVNKLGYYTVRVTDQYGNMFMQSIKITECDSKPPVIPVLKTYAADTFVVTGTAEKNAFVTVYVNGKPYTCTANSKGAFKCTLPSKLIKGSLIEATAQDISGNISEKAEAMLE